MMHIPSATYRIQLHKDFTFKELSSILDYLQALGISTIYAAPVLRSRPGSMHGYDVVDPHKIDKEIGTYDDLKDLSEELTKRNMFWLQDIVPNHMAFDSGNAKLMDVLERGPLSPYYNYFDIDWNHPSADLKGKVSVPFLGAPLGEAVEKGEIKISFTEKGLKVSYFDNHYPLSIPAFGKIVFENKALKNFVKEFQEAAASAKSLEEWQPQKLSLYDAILKDGELKKDVIQACERLNNNPKELLNLLESQYYLLCFWKESEKRINYRRFFTVNELICLRMEDEKTFHEYHRLIGKLYNDGIIQGVRIDHIDGLHDPEEYVDRLRKYLGPDCYIIAEKILEASEQMPVDWKLQGTSGYEFLSYVSQLVTDRKGAQKLVGYYDSKIPQSLPYDKMVLNNKKLILENYMVGEWDNLTHLFLSLELNNGFDRDRMKEAIAMFMLCMPVYRIYPRSLPLDGEGKSLVEEAFAKAISLNKDYEHELTYLSEMFIGSSPKKTALQFLKRLMQFTGPLTAKGVEDTTFYVYNPLISHDEVGDSPSSLGISVHAYHSKMMKRQQATPLSLNATATHDTKRGEDSRLRLNVISEVPEEWQKQVEQWFQMNMSLKKDVAGELAPTINDEYFIYQSLLGGLPETLEVDNEFFSRFDDFLVKAIREAKVNSNWSEPNEEYESACKQFVRSLFAVDHGFAASFLPFAAMMIRYGSIYSLVQVLLKVTSPGIPDIYQGCELWDLSFVDPDNRRPIDYRLRIGYLSEVLEKEKEGSPQLLSFLKSKRRQGVEKLFVTYKALQFRKQNPDLFVEGEYIPLKVEGRNTVVAAFARVLKKKWCIVAAPLALAANRVTDQPYADIPDESSFIALPDEAPADWTNIFTGEGLQPGRKVLVFDLFKDFPVALLTNL